VETRTPLPDTFVRDYLKRVMMRKKGLRKGNYVTKHGMRHTRLYATWSDMINRTQNKNGSRYSEWGCRGISVCEEWKIASNFLKWALENGYRDGLLIDRINNNGNYCPENCRFVNRSISSFNRRKRENHNIGAVGNKFRVRLTLNGIVRYDKSFKDYNEAVIYRDKYSKLLNDEREIYNQ
jgi:hypothetical protein